MITKTIPDYCSEDLESDILVNVLSQKNIDRSKK